MAKILLVDDENDFRMLVGIYIKRWGYELIETANGEEAVEQVKKEKPDLIIIDYMMPKMDGIATLKEINKIDNIPAIMLTAASKESLSGIENVKIDAFLPKIGANYDFPKELQAAIEKIIPS